MPVSNMEPGQYALGDTVMGPYTPFKIESLDIGNYEVNAQDYQNQQSNELRFGQDTLKPAPIQLTINVIANRALPNIGGLVHSGVVLNFADDPDLAQLQKEWRAEDVLQEWGELKPLLFCGSDGVVRQFYGRPGKFTYKKHRQINSLYYIVQAEFRRSDTYAHSQTEYFVTFNPGIPQTVTRVLGNATGWLRFIIVGPANHPIINWGTKQIELDWNIPAGQSVEISSYPWERRVVDSNGLSLAAKIITDRPYLDTIRFPDHVPMLTSWSATGTTSASKLILFWHDAYQVMD